MSYGTILWGFSFHSHVRKLHILQKLIARIICNVPSYAHSAPLFSHLKILNVFDICRYQTAAFTYAYINGFLPSNLNNFFKDHTCNYPTRQGSTTSIVPCFYILSSSQRFVKYTGPKIWNDLPIFNDYLLNL